MIQLIRDRKKITSGLKGDKRVAKNLALLKLKQESGELASKQFKSNLWKPAKPQLKIESNGKCAYCEADTSVLAHGDVEHFRPKNVYWWLAYCYDNYLYSCQICNQTFKSNKFPVSGTKLKGPRITSRTSEARLNEIAETMTPDPQAEHTKAREEFFKLAENEEADLIDPYMQDPAEWLIYEVDEDLLEVEVKVKPRAKHRAAKQKAIDKVYGLNREELKRLRYQDYKQAEMLSRLLDDPKISEASVNSIKAMLKTLKADNRRFAGMIKYFVEKEWKLDVGD